MTYLEHIEKLARDLNITIKWITDKYKSMSNVPTRIIRIVKPLNSFDYLVALHEIGHIQTTTWDDGESSIEQELKAYQWAKAHAIEWDKGTCAAVKYGMGTYLNNPFTVMEDIHTAKTAYQWVNTECRIP
jgi:hypothetical protein